MIERDESLLTNQDYKNALLSQDACNASGLVLALARVMPRIWNEARKAGKGTEYVNRHPIVYLYVFQLINLTGTGRDTDDIKLWQDAIKTCEEGQSR